MMKACVVIPIYTEKISDRERVSLEQCFSILGHYNIYFIAPKKLAHFIKHLPYVLKGQAKYKLFDNQFFKDIPSYNRLMKFKGLYQSFIAYEFMLIHQLDAFVFKDELKEWCFKGYDYIGAPLFDGHDTAAKEALIVGQGNGGFSLRNIRKCYQVVSSFKKLKFSRVFDRAAGNWGITFYRFIKHQMIFIYSGYPFQPIINEDLFWAEVVPNNFSTFKVPDATEAMKFSFEVNPEVLFALNHEELPFGCHAWWKYSLDFWRPYINTFGYNI